MFAARPLSFAAVCERGIVHGAAWDLERQKGLRLFVDHAHGMSAPEACLRTQVPS